MSNIQLATDELHVAFRCLNDHFFGGKMPEPAITIQSGGKRRTMGWCTTQEIWRDSTGEIRKYEINIAAEYLNIDFYETMDTMLHEMIHLYCKINGIKDTSRGGAYHNKRFKEECLRRGFYYARNKPDPRIGWSYAKITDETKRVIDTFPINRDVFRIARATFGRLLSGEGSGSQEPEAPSEPSGDDEGEERPRSHIIKWVCPSCNITVRSSKVVHVMCGDCMETMVPAGKREKLSAGKRARV